MLFLCKMYLNNSVLLKMLFLCKMYLNNSVLLKMLFFCKRLYQGILLGHQLEAKKLANIIQRKNTRNEIQKLLVEGICN